MPIPFYSLTPFYLLFFFLGGCQAQPHGPAIQEEKNINYHYTTVVDEIPIPWGMAFLPNDELLVTEKSGVLYRVTQGIKKAIEGVPPVYVRGQGGLLDVAISPNYTET